MTAARKNTLKRPRTVDKGGIEASAKQPLGRAPLRETYGARSGEKPEREGTPRTVSSGKAGGKAGAETGRKA